MATHSSIPDCRIPCTEEPGGPPSIRSQRVRHDGVTFTFTTLTRESETEQVLAPHPPPRTMPSAFCLRKTWVKKISLIREVRNAETKESSQRKLNNNNTATKHSQGPLALSQGLWIMLWAISVSCLIDTKTPGGEVNCMTARPYPGLELPKFRELTAKKWGENGPWNCRLTLPKSTKMMVVRPLMTNLKMTVRDDCTVSACSPPPPTHSVCKSSHPLLVGGGRLAFGQMSVNRPPAPSAPSCQHLI